MRSEPRRGAASGRQRPDGCAATESPTGSARSWALPTKRAYSPRGCGPKWPYRASGGGNILPGLAQPIGGISCPFAVGRQAAMSLSQQPEHGVEDRRTILPQFVILSG
jgi:hypothetical protein